MMQPSLGYQGERRFLSNSAETPEEKIRSREKKMDKERLGRRNKARDIISTMDDVKTAEKDDEQAFEQNQITHMGDETDTAEKLVEKRVDRGEKILDQVEKEDGTDELRGAIEILKQVVDSAEKQKEVNKSPEANYALDRVIEDANENIKLRQAFLEYYEKADAEAQRVHDDYSVEKSAEQDEEEIISTREKLKETYEKKANE